MGHLLLWLLCIFLLVAAVCVWVSQTAAHLVTSGVCT